MHKFLLEVYTKRYRNATTRARRALKEEGLVVLIADEADFSICRSVAESMITNGHAGYYSMQLPGTARREICLAADLTGASKLPEINWRRYRAEEGLVPG